jgi:hypothetical protein
MKKSTLFIIAAIAFFGCSKPKANCSYPLPADAKFEYNPVKKKYKVVIGDDYLLEWAMIPSYKYTTSYENEMNYKTDPGEYFSEPPPIALFDDTCIAKAAVKQYIARMAARAKNRWEPVK